MNKSFPQPLHLRPDVSMWRHNDEIYLTTSRGPLRLRSQLIENGRDTAEVDQSSFLGSLAPNLLRGLQSQGFLLDRDQPALQHPLYQDGGRNGFPTLAIVDEALGRSIVACLRSLGMPTALVSPERSTIEDASIAILPLSLSEQQLEHWNALTAPKRCNIVVYLSTPTRLLLAVLEPFRTPCPLCLARRLRMTYPSQEIARSPLGLGQLFGAASDTVWPTDMLSAAYIAHVAVINGISKEQEQEPKGVIQLLEIDYEQLETRRHPLLRLPHCPGCAINIPQSQDIPPSFPASEEFWTVPERSWEQMQICLSPLTGIVSSITTEEEKSGGIIWAYTDEQTDTTWISPVRAQSRGGSAKWDMQHAKASALGEALERYACGIYDPRLLVRGSLLQLEPVAIDPRSLPLGSEKEYNQLNGRLVPYYPDLEIDWVRGMSLITHSPRLIPACAVYVPYKFPRRQERLLRPISTGLAAGATRSEAILAGLYEAIERDAFVIYWENILIAPTIDLDTLPECPARAIIERFRASGLKLTCKLVTTDIDVPAVVIMSIQWIEGSPLVAFSSRANLDFLTCLQRALEEHEQSRISIKNRIKDHGVPPDNRVLREMEDFFTYYCREDRLKYLDFVHEGPVMPIMQQEANYSTPTAAMREVLKRLERRGYEAIAVDITPTDVAQSGIYVIRSIVPGLQPVTFGRDFRHLGGQRLYLAPIWMGLREHPLREDQLNPYPMPGG